MRVRVRTGARTRITAGAQAYRSVDNRSLLDGDGVGDAHNLLGGGADASAVDAVPVRVRVRDRVRVKVRVRVRVS